MTLIQELRDMIGTQKMRSKTKGTLCATSGVFQKQGEGMARQINNAGEKRLPGRLKSDGFILAVMNIIK